MSKKPSKNRVGVSLSDVEADRLAHFSRELGVSRAALVSAAFSFSAGCFDSMCVNPAYKMNLGVTRRGTDDLHNFLLSSLMYENSRSVTSDQGDLFRGTGISIGDVQDG